jgi:hypothetical protein
MRSTDSAKPRASMVSASSSTTVAMLSSESWRWSSRSMMRPGVPTTMSAPRRSLSSLLVVRGAAKDLRHSAVVGQHFVALGGDLNGELARRHENDGDRRASTRFRTIQKTGFDNRQNISKSLWWG